MITLGEYRYGLRRSDRKKSIESKLLDFLSDVAILDIREDTTTIYADVRYKLRTAGTPIPENDIWIASLARQHNTPILSNDKHFDLVPDIRRLSW